MNGLGRKILAVVAGLVAGSLVNMAVLGIGGQVIAPPAGSDTSTTEGLAASMHLFGARHFVFPFLAHLVGTLAGAWLGTRLYPGRRALPAVLVGAFFLAGGIAASVMLPAPAWFIAADLVLAYLPGAWIGWRLAQVRGS